MHAERLRQREARRRIVVAPRPDAVRPDRHPVVELDPAQSCQRAAVSDVGADFVLRVRRKRLVGGRIRTGNFAGSSVFRSAIRTASSSALVLRILATPPYSGNWTADTTDRK